MLLQEAFLPVVLGNLDVGPRLEVILVILCLAQMRMLVRFGIVQERHFGVGGVPAHQVWISVVWVSTLRHLRHIDQCRLSPKSCLALEFLSSLIQLDEPVFTD